MAISVSEELREAWAEADRRTSALATQLGFLVMDWSYLDREIDALLVPLLQCTPAEVSCIVSNVENVASRCEIVKRLLVLHLPSSDFREWLVALLDRIARELAPLRNRYIHDNWISRQMRSVRVDKRAKIIRKESRAKPSVQFDAHTATSGADVERLTRAVTAAVDALRYGNDALKAWRLNGEHITLDTYWAPVASAGIRYLNQAEHDEATAAGRAPPDFIAG
jgi:hypothetical protein